jgi:CPA1 family monovalent cation:H+ antiporter
MSIFQLAALLLVLAALFGLANHHWLKLPTTIGLVIIALAVSLTAMAIDAVLPFTSFAEKVRGVILGIDFHEALMNGMLSFLLFAGALHVNLADLAKQKWVITLTASLGVLISTLVVGFGFQALTGAPLLVALVFGALISPTDPVAVLGILKKVRVPKSLETKIAGESLFNDGVGIVVFLIIVGLAFGSSGEPMGAGEVIELFAVEALGGAALGFITGWLGYRALRSVNEHNLEVIITLAVATGVYALAHELNLSGPIAVVVAGLWIGNHGVRFGMSETTQAHLLPFWNLVDEVLNAVLFLLIGLEVFALTDNISLLPAALACIPLVLFARLLAVGVPIYALRPFRRFTRGSLAVLFWGGLRGGISVALVLSLPATEYKPLLLTATYAVVIFSIIVQGLSMQRVITRFVRQDQEG